VSYESRHTHLWPNQTDRLGTPAVGSASNLLLGGGGGDHRPDHLECHWDRSRSARVSVPRRVVPDGHFR
jgi:hypothetical protein